MTKKVVPNKNGQYFLDSKAISQVKYDKFVKGKLTEEESFWDTMTKEKLSTFAANNKTVKVTMERKIVNIGGSGKYSGQKPLFLPPPPPPHTNSGTLTFSLFFCLRKNCNHHQRHHFHLCFCWVLSIGWGEMIFYQKVGRRGVKH